MRGFSLLLIQAIGIFFVLILPAFASGASQVVVAKVIADENGIIIPINKSKYKYDIKHPYILTADVSAEYTRYTTISDVIEYNLSGDEHEVEVEGRMGDRDAKSRRYIEKSGSSRFRIPTEDVLQFSVTPNNRCVYKVTYFGDCNNGHDGKCISTQKSIFEFGEDLTGERYVLSRSTVSNTLGNKISYHLGSLRNNWLLVKNGSYDVFKINLDKDLSGLGSINLVVNQRLKQLVVGIKKNWGISKLSLNIDLNKYSRMSGADEYIIEIPLRELLDGSNRGLSDDLNDMRLVSIVAFTPADNGAVVNAPVKYVDFIRSVSSKSRLDNSMNYEYNQDEFKVSLPVKQTITDAYNSFDGSSLSVEFNDTRCADTIKSVQLRRYVTKWIPKYFKETITSSLNTLEERSRALTGDFDWINYKIRNAFPLRDMGTGIYMSQNSVKVNSGYKIADLANLFQDFEGSYSDDLRAYVLNFKFQDQIEAEDFLYIDIAADKGSIYRVENIKLRFSNHQEVNVPHNNGLVNLSDYAERSLFTVSVVVKAISQDHKIYLNNISLVKKSPKPWRFAINERLTLPGFSNLIQFKTLHDKERSFNIELDEYNRNSTVMLVDYNFTGGLPNGAGFNVLEFIDGIYKRSAFIDVEAPHSRFFITMDNNITGKREFKIVPHSDERYLNSDLEIDVRFLNGEKKSFSKYLKDCYSIKIFNDIYYPTLVSPYFDHSDSLMLSYGNLKTNGILDVDRFQRRDDCPIGIERLKVNVQDIRNDIEVTEIGFTWGEIININAAPWIKIVCSLLAIFVLIPNLLNIYSAIRKK